MFKRRLRGRKRKWGWWEGNEEEEEEEEVGEGKRRKKGEWVTDYQGHVQFLLEKDERIKVEKLGFGGKNLVLYFDGEEKKGEEGGGEGEGER